MKSSNKLALLACAAALSGAAGPGAAQSEAASQARWVADQKGCKHYSPTPQAGEQLTWSGACKDGRGDGPGELRWIVAGELRQIMQATLVDGKAQGQASVNFSSGAHYLGQVRDSQIDGQGVLSVSNGTSYEGPFERGIPSGQGTLRWANGNRFEGSFAEGFRGGKGRLKLPGGERYDGDFMAGVPEGQGVLERADGGRYEGRFTRGAPGGPGVATLADGTRFEGEFSEGRPTGLGQFKNAAGDVLPRPASVALQQRMSFLAPTPQSSQHLVYDARRICPRMGPPSVPANLNWRGQVAFNVLATQSDGKVTEVKVADMRVVGIIDNRAKKMLTDAIELAVKSYECTGSGPFQIQQEFVFRID